MSKHIVIPIVIVSLLMASMAVTGRAEALAGCGSYYTVQWGDTLSGIAAMCGTSMTAIRQANPGVYSWVYAGQVLAMPGYAPGSGTFTCVVARGDTLKKLAARFGTTMYAIAALNGLINYDLIYAGQVLTIPGSGSWTPPATPLPPAPPYSGSTYVVQRGDTLRILAIRWNVSIFDILAVNSQIKNVNVIYAGQVINIPGTGGSASAKYYTVQRGDTLRIIANIYGTTIYNLLVLNPQIWNANLIYPGMVIRVK